MFEIEYKGAGTVVVSTKKSKLITDPKLSIVGLKDMNTKDAIALSTEERFALNDPEALLNIESPGEYEVGDFSIRGVAAQRHIDSKEQPKVATIYRIELGEVRIALIGNIDATLEESQLEELGVIDLVIIPVGGNGYTLDGVSAAHLVRAMDAKVVIPIHYNDTSLKYEVPQDGLESFKKEFAGEVETVAKYKVKSASSLPLVPTVIEITRS